MNIYCGQSIGCWCKITQNNKMIWTLTPSKLFLYTWIVGLINTSCHFVGIKTRNPSLSYYYSKQGLRLPSVLDVFETPYRGAVFRSVTDVFPGGPGFTRHGMTSSNKSSKSEDVSSMLWNERLNSEDDVKRTHGLEILHICLTYYLKPVFSL